MLLSPLRTLPSTLANGSSLARCRVPRASAPLSAKLSARSLRPISFSTPPEQPQDDEDDPLHYHPFPSSTPPVLALSFLPTAPASPRSATILGWLPLDKPGVDLRSFKENEKFVSLLHGAVQDGLAQGVDEDMKAEGEGIGQGWIHITDQRAARLPSRVGDADDLVGSVYVLESKIQPESYTPMPSHRLITPEGPTRLGPALMEQLLAALRTTYAEEEVRSG